MPQLSNPQRALLLAAAQTGTRLVLFDHDQAICGPKQIHPFPLADLEQLVQFGMLRKLTQGSRAYAVTEEGFKHGHALRAAEEESS